MPRSIGSHDRAVLLSVHVCVGTQAVWPDHMLLSAQHPTVQNRFASVLTRHAAVAAGLHCIKVVEACPLTAC